MLSFAFIFKQMAQAIFDGKMEEEIIAEIPELTEIEDQKLAHKRLVYESRLINLLSNM